MLGECVTENSLGLGFRKVRGIKGQQAQPPWQREQLVPRLSSVKGHGTSQGLAQASIPGQTEHGGKWRDKAGRVSGARRHRAGKVLLSIWTLSSIIKGGRRKVSESR